MVLLLSQTFIITHALLKLDTAVVVDDQEAWSIVGQPILLHLEFIIIILHDDFSEWILINKRIQLPKMVNYFDVIYSLNSFLIDILGENTKN